MSFLPGMAGVAGASRTTVFSLQKAVYFSEANQSAYTDSSVPLGPVAADRRIIVVTTGATLTAEQFVSGVTVGGTSLNEDLFSRNTGNSQNAHVAVYSAIVASGTSGDVVVTWTGGMIEAMIATYRVTGLLNNALHDTESGGGGVLPMSLNIPANGVAVGCACYITAGFPSWTGLISDGAQSFDSRAHGAASQGPLLAQTGRTITPTVGGTPSRYACASYG